MPAGRAVVDRSTAAVRYQLVLVLIQRVLRVHRHLSL
jgi:hypothetical protein